MAKFFTMFDRPPVKGTNPGEEFEPVLELEYDEYGAPQLVKTGQQRPLREMIAAAASYGVVDLSAAYERYIAGEDIQIVIKRASELCPMEGIYGDFSQFSDDPLENILRIKRSAQAVSDAYVKHLEESKNSAAEPVSKEGET